MERERYLLNFYFISFGIFAWLLCSNEIYSWSIWELSFFPNQVLKYISCLRWLISPNSVWSCPLMFSYFLLWCVGSLPADTIHTRDQVDSAKQARNLLAARLKKVLSVWRDQFEWGQISPFCCQGLLSVSAFFKFISILFIFIFISTHDKCSLFIVYKTFYLSNCWMPFC